MPSRILRSIPAAAPALLLFFVALLLLLSAPARSQTTTTSSLATALDSEVITVTSTGAGAWFAQTKHTRDGVDAVQSGALAANGKATLSATITGVTKFSFAWKVSSEGKRDILTFYIDDVAQPNPISGNVNWQTRTYTLSGTGSHTLRWEYAKDGSVNSYLDAAFVDQFTLLETSAPTITAQPSAASIAPGENAVLSVQALGGAPLAYQWYAGERGVITAPVEGATGPMLVTPPLRTTTSYWVRVSQDDETVDSRSVSVTVTARRGYSLLANGDSSGGALGTELDYTLRPAKTSPGVVQASAGGNHTLFLRADGSLRALGTNISGQLGDGTTVRRDEPVVIFAGGVASIAAGSSHSLVLKTDGTLWAFGHNGAGQLGDGTTEDRLAPVQIDDEVAAVAAGFAHSLFLKTDGTLWAMGAYTPALTSLTPTRITADSDIVAIAAGQGHSLYIKANGTLWAFGTNFVGQLGDSSTDDRDEPVEIADRVVSVSAGAQHSLFIRSDASLWTMGDNSSGQLGAPALATEFASAPLEIARSVGRVSAGFAHSIFVKTDGTAWAFGDNASGQLGDGTVIARPLPSMIASGIVDVSAGASHSLLLQNPPSHTVTFVLGQGARRTGGGALVQTIREGEAAVVPVFTPPTGKTFQTWSADFQSVTSPLTVNAIYGVTQTIDFPQPAAPVFVAPGGTLTLSASSSSGLPVSFEYVSGPATLAENVLNYTAAGTVVVRAVRPAGMIGGVDYAAAAAVQRNIVITLKPQKITFTTPSSATYGDAPLELSATSDIPDHALTFAVISGPAVLNDDSTISLTGAGSVVVGATQAGDAVYAPATKNFTIEVAKKPLAVSVANTTRAVNQPNPAFILLYTGFVNGDTATKPGVITAAPTATCRAGRASPPGEYPIIISGGTAPNYTFASTAPYLRVVGYGGSYEALLGMTGSDEAPVGKLELTVSAKTLQYSGILSLATDPKPLTFIGTLVPSADFATAAHTFTRAASAALPAVELTFALNVGGLSGALDLGEDETIYFEDGVRLGAPPAPLGEGAHTLVIGASPLQMNDNPVSGAGHASAAISPTSANLVLRGKLADGKLVTATLKSSPARDYRLWANPYGTRTRSFLAGRLALAAHPESRLAGRYYISEDSDSALCWSKAPLPATTHASRRDPSYRDGIGPLFCPIRLDPWLPPLAATRGREAVTLAQRLGLATNNTASAALDVEYGSAESDFGASTGDLPSSLTLSAAGRVTIASPITTPANRAAWKLISLDPATGAFSGRFQLSDTDPDNNRAIPRAVDFSGTLRQPPATETGAPVAEGFLLLPDLDPAAEKTSHAFRLLPVPAAE